jgi:hypothetical protein
MPKWWDDFVSGTLDVLSAPAKLFTGGGILEKPVKSAFGSQTGSLTPFTTQIAKDITGEKSEQGIGAVLSHTIKGGGLIQALDHTIKKSEDIIDATVKKGAEISAKVPIVGGAISQEIEAVGSAAKGALEEIKPSNIGGNVLAEVEKDTGVAGRIARNPQQFATETVEKALRKTGINPRGQIGQRVIGEVRPRVGQFFQGIQRGAGRVAM